MCEKVPFRKSGHKCTIPGADLGGFLRFLETGQVYSGNQNYILQ